MEVGNLEWTREFWKKFEERDQDAWTEVYGLVFSIARHYFYPKEEAMGAAHDFLASLAGKDISSFHPPRGKSYFQTAVRNFCKDSGRKKAQEADGTFTPLDIEIPTRRAQYLAELRYLLKECLETLPPATRKVFDLSTIGLNRSEIASILGKNKTAVSALLYLARIRLEHCLRGVSDGH